MAHRPVIRVRTALLGALLLAGCAAPDPVPDPAPDPAPVVTPGIPTVVTLGDSVPAGTACDCDPFPDLYARELSPPGVSLNEAVPGDTSADLLGRLADPDIRSALDEATVVLVMIGANDLADAFDNGRDEDAYRDAAAQVETNVVAIVAAVRREHPVPVLVLGYWNVVKDGAVGLAAYGADGVRSAEAATRYADAALRRAAGRSGARYVPTTPAFKGDARDQDPTNLLAADGDHPDAEGHVAIAEALYAAVPDP